MLYKLSVFRPNSSSDPLTRATFSPGEGIDEVFLRRNNSQNISFFLFGAVVS